ncbi:MAG: hypothetical protein HQ564_09170 [Candidatus Saganbacteria bacterium]|nr:hypothetical protein [Candidatus Saganbacteria bacterium]
MSILVAKIGPTLQRQISTKAYNFLRIIAGRKIFLSAGVMEQFTDGAIKTSLADKILIEIKNKIRSADDLTQERLNESISSAVSKLSSQGIEIKNLLSDDFRAELRDLQIEFGEYFQVTGLNDSKVIATPDEIEAMDLPLEPEVPGGALVLAGGGMPALFGIDQDTARGVSHDLMLRFYSDFLNLKYSAEPFEVRKAIRMLPEIYPGMKPHERDHVDSVITGVFFEQDDTVKMEIIRTLDKLGFSQEFLRELAQFVSGDEAQAQSSLLAIIDLSAVIGGYESRFTFELMLHLVKEETNGTLLTTALDNFPSFAKPFSEAQKIPEVLRALKGRMIGEGGKQYRFGVEQSLRALLEVDREQTIAEMEGHLNTRLFSAFHVLILKLLLDTYQENGKKQFALKRLCDLLAQKLHSIMREQLMTILEDAAADAIPAIIAGFDSFREEEKAKFITLLDKLVMQNLGDKVLQEITKFILPLIHDPLRFDQVVGMKVLHLPQFDAEVRDIAYEKVFANLVRYKDNRDFVESIIANGERYLPAIALHLRKRKDLFLVKIAARSVARLNSAEGDFGTIVNGIFNLVLKSLLKREDLLDDFCDMLRSPAVGPEQARRAYSELIEGETRDKKEEKYRKGLAALSSNPSLPKMLITTLFALQKANAEAALSMDIVVEDEGITDLGDGLFQLSEDPDDITDEKWELYSEAIDGISNLSINPNNDERGSYLQYLIDQRIQNQAEPEACYAIARGLMRAYAHGLLSDSVAKERVVKLLTEQIAKLAKEPAKRRKFIEVITNVEDVSSWIIPKGLPEERTKLYSNFFKFFMTDVCAEIRRMSGRERENALGFLSRIKDAYGSEGEIRKGMLSIDLEDAIDIHVGTEDVDIIVKE